MTDGSDAAWIKDERRHEFDMASLRSKDAQRQREALSERIRDICIASAVIGVTAILAWLIISWVHSSGGRGMELEKTCISEGGTWTTLGRGTGKMCIHLKVQQ